MIQKARLFLFLLMLLGGMLSPKSQEAADCVQTKGQNLFETPEMLLKNLIPAIERAKDRRKSATSNELLSFKVVKQQGNSKSFLAALSGFQVGGPPQPNNLRVLGLEHSSRGWKWSSVIETNAKELDAVFSLNLKE